MIDNVDVTKDKADFPIVTWREARGFMGREKIECRIMKTTDGDLYFVARGHVRLGQFEEGQPWQMLEGFAIKTGAELYQDQTERALQQHFAHKNPMIGGLLQDGNKVLVAGFRVGMPIHLNYADAPLGVMERLHGILMEAFVHGARAGRAVDWRCAPDDERMETYEPSRTGWPDEPKSKRTKERILLGLANAGLAAVALAMAAFLVYMLLMMVGVVRP